MSLQISIGHLSAVGPRERNEDFCGFVTPTASALATKGVLLALADGVSMSRGGREAAEFSVRGVLSDYYATPETWSVPHALDRVIQSINRWVIGQSRSERESGGATTLSTLVLRGRRWYVAHVGDSRIYLIRDGKLRRLTVDHVWDRPEMQHVLTRAIGLDARLLLDHSDESIKEGDCFVLATDGVWEPLGDRELHRIVGESDAPQAAAEALVREALEREGRDNATAMVLRVDRLPEELLRDALADSDQFAVPPRLKAGEVLDGFSIVEVLHESRATIVYKASDSDGAFVVLKTLPPALAQDKEQRSALMAEEWLARRLVSLYFPEALPLEGRRTALYYAMTFHEGASLQQHLDAGRHFPIVEVVSLGVRLMKALGALHRRDVLHRDIKPANLHLGGDGRLRILDFGVARSAVGEDESAIPGTPSYMAPELIGGDAPHVQSDLYAAGVTLYHLLTRKYPYGEIEPFQHPRFGEPTPPSRYRPDVPYWLEAILLKAVARERKLRFETAEEFLLALERGENQTTTAPPRTPIARDPLRLWKSIATAAIILNLLLLYLLAVR
ncbi:MAG TPA: bifunctional protein-serine/threonine kinase/phosphatase [Burkholderiales bacterium]|nr:bifunctional protein-serine/threonine kinase/phosphatase [Burkholderiales bacterium]